VPSTPRPTPVPSLAPTVNDLATVSATITFTGLDASNVGEDDISAIKTGLAAILSGVYASNIDNVRVVDTSTRRLGSRVGRRRRLATTASVDFDISVSIDDTLFFANGDDFYEEVRAELLAAQSDSEELVSGIQDAATSTTFDSLRTTTAVTLDSIEQLTRPPTHAPTYLPTNSWVDDYVSSLATRENEHFYLVGMSTFVITCYTIFVFYSKPKEVQERIGLSNLPIPIFAWFDFVGDISFIDLLWHRAATIRRLGLENRPDAEEEYEVSSGIVSILFPPESCETLHNISSEARPCETALPGDLRLVNSFIAIAVIGVVIPTILQTYFVRKLVKQSIAEDDMDEKFTCLTRLTIIISCTDPDAVMLLPFREWAYEDALKGQPHPNKRALRVTGWKAVEDFVELITQLAYVLAFRDLSTFVALNLIGTLVMMSYNLIGKIIFFVCVPVQHPKFTDKEKYTWDDEPESKQSKKKKKKSVANSKHFDQFLEQAKIEDPSTRKKLKILLLKEPMVRIGDLEKLCSAKVQAYVDQDGVAHNYVVKLVKYVREVFKAHGKEDLLVDLIEPLPQTPRASANEQGTRPKHIRAGSSDLSSDGRRGLERVNSSKLRREKVVVKC